MATLDDAGVTDACKQIRGLTILLPAAIAELRRRGRAAASDGYPTDSMREYSSPGTEVDDDKTPLPPRSDPTARAAASNADHPFHRAANDVITKLNNARRELEQAEGLAAKHGVLVEFIDGRPRISQAPHPVDRPKPDSEIFCANHLAAGLKEPIGTKGRRGLCDFCEETEREFRHRPPAWLLQRRATRRLSTRDMEEFKTWLHNRKRRR